VTNALAAGIQKCNADEDKAKVAGDQLANQLTSGDQQTQQAFSQALARAVATGGCGSVSQVLAGVCVEGGGGGNRGGVCTDHTPVISI
jgi:flagellar basal body rod protein FlgG